MCRLAHKSLCLCDETGTPTTHDPRRGTIHATSWLLPPLAMAFMCMWF